MMKTFNCYDDSQNGYEIDFIFADLSYDLSYDLDYYLSLLKNFN